MGGTIKNKNASKNRNTTKKNKQDIKLLSNKDLDKKYFKMFGYGEPKINKHNSMNKNMNLRGPKR